MMDITADTREEQAYQLLERGYASMKELMIVSFGEWPPKGLDVPNDLLDDENVIIEKGSLNQNVVGNASLCGQRKITINLKKDLGCLCLTMAHESIHILQGDHSLRKYTKEDLFNSIFYKKTTFYKEGPTSNKIMEKLEAEESARTSTLKKMCQKFNAVTNKEEKKLAYLKKGIEIQARLHVLLIEGYQRWGKMPQNRDELWMALQDSGLAMPPKVGEYLEALPSASKAFDFQTGDEIDILSSFMRQGGFNNLESVGAVQTEIDQVTNSLSTAGQETFWHETIPALYADLIEMYGDRLGRERFGLGANPRSNAPAASKPITTHAL